ncbi:MAG: DUF2970 domain-containing protein [Oceanococcus sp.]
MALEPKEPAEERHQAPSFLQTAGSVLASFFGVQSRRNRERDFSSGNPIHFALMGLLVTAGFIGVVLLAVKFALSQAGS